MRGGEQGPEKGQEIRALRTDGEAGLVPKRIELEEAGAGQAAKLVVDVFGILAG